MGKTIAFCVVGLILLVFGSYPELFIPAMRAANYHDSRYLGKVIFGLVGIPGILCLLLGYGGILQFGRKRRHEQRRQSHAPVDSSPDGGAKETLQIERND